MSAILEKVDPFMERIVLSLLPFFVATTASLQDARIAILNALASYGARTEAEMVEAGQILGLGLAALKSLGESAVEGTSLATRLRLRGNANALVRSKKHCQQALTNSLAGEVAEYPPRYGEPQVEEEPFPDLGAAIQHARVMAQEAQHQAAPLTTEPSKAAAPQTSPSVAAPTQAAPTQAKTSTPALAKPALTQDATHAMALPAIATLTPEQRNNLMWASAMGRVISEILPNRDPAST